MEAENNFSVFMPEKEELLARLKTEGFSFDIINAFRQVERADFVPGPYRAEAYDNKPLPIGYGQTISQPSTIAFMLEKLEPKDGLKILEVGSGSGYVLSLLDKIVDNAELYGAERVEELVHNSRYTLAAKNNIHIHHTPETLGLPEQAPFDRILVSAAAENALPQELVEQLKEGGVIVCPVRHSIIKVKKRKGGETTWEEFPGFAFVPLVRS
jgi:protein-L-isoaspartate(D-aspartate) O-methyltransferase